MGIDWENETLEEKNIKLDKGVFINMGTLFHDSVLNSVARKMKVICCCKFGAWTLKAY